MKFNFFALILSLTIGQSFAQESTKPSWSAENSKSKSFIENQGQFDHEESLSIGKIHYAIDFGSTKIFFGEKGISYNFLEIQKKSREERAEIMNQPKKTFDEHKQKERLAGKFLIKSDQVNMAWENPNSKVEISGVGVAPDYHSYTYTDKNNQTQNINYVKGYEYIVYKNIYPNIDIKYEIHPIIGVKYAFILHPGANASQIKMTFDRDISLKNGEIFIPTLFGDVIDHAPVTFYENEKENIINSKYAFNKNQITFDLEDFDASKTIVIDPWVQTPVFPSNWDCVWELDTDAVGNVYIIGGVDPLQLKKYNSAGVLQWSFDTPYDTTAWLGTMATDDVGNSYVTNGTDYKILKVNAAGGLVWSNNAPSGGQISTEFWNISFNCDQTKLIVGGTGGNLDIHGKIYEVNMANGNITTSVQVTSVGDLFAIPPQLQEVRGMSAAPNGKYYFVTLDTIGYMNDNLSLCPAGSTSLYMKNHSVNWGYKSENWRYNNTGIKVIRADANFVYINKGNALQKRSLIDFSIIGSVAIPGGVLSTPFLSDNVTENAGIDIDDCGNIYVGSKTGVYKFNSSLVQQAFYATTFIVYDVRVNTGGEVVACGGTGDSNSGTRSGGVQSFAASACPMIAITCCDATVCIPQDVCDNDTPITLTPAVAGGTWSGTGVSSAGVFSPALVGAGLYTITYTLSCGSESIIIAVNPCSTLLGACVEANGTLTALNGVSPYSWQNSTTTIPCITGIGSYCGLFTVAGAPVTTWTTFATGTNIPSPGTWPVQLIDNLGSSIIYVDLAAVPSCVGAPCPTLTLTNSSQTNVLCFGNSTGAATISASGGTGSYTYTWTPGNLNGGTQNNLAAGAYTVNVVDGNLCPGSTTVTITQPVSALTVSMASTPTDCGASDGTATATPSGGTGSYTYSWSPSGGNTATASNLTPGSYVVTVTDGNSCQTTGNVSVAAIGGPIISVVSFSDVSCNNGNDGAATVSATGSGTLTYSWMPGSLSGTTQSALAANAYTVTVTDGVGCSNSTTVTIGEPTQIVITETISDANCGSTDGQISSTVAGGSGTYTYLWTPNGEITSSISNLSSGSYSLQVTDSDDCSVSETYSVVTTGILPITVTPLSSTIQAGESVQLTASGATTYSWTPTNGLSCSDCPNPIASPNTTTIYTVTGTDASGCIGSADVIIIVPTVCGDIFVPTVFAPSDGGAIANNTLCVFGNCIAELNYAVYNRWGEKVFETTDATICWDGTYKGKPLNSGVFAYKLVVTLFDGTSIMESGNVTLIR